MKVSIDTKIYNAFVDNGNSVFRNEKTIGYIFKNTGNSPVYLNNYLLLPNECYKTFESNLFDMTLWRLQWVLSNNLYAGCGTTNGELTVLIYSEE